VTAARVEEAPGRTRGNRPPTVPTDYLPEASWQGSRVEFPTPPRRRPLVLAAAVVDVVIALMLVALAWWWWHRGVIVTMRHGVAMNRVEGRWWAAATGAVTLAGLLLLDAGRRVMSEASRQHSR
jgi:hypothetical protein